VKSSADPASFADAVAVWRDGVDDALTGIARRLDSDDPVSGAMRYALGAGGKRLRPILCLAAMDAAGDPPGRAPARLQAAAAVELIHTYSLVHDDLPCMDDDAMRRGRPTTHRAFGTRPAMIGAFALIPLACRVLQEAAAGMNVDAATGAAAVRELCRGAGAAGMVGGQVLDLAAEHRRVGRDELARIHLMKTGALFRASLRVGAVLAAAGPAAVDALGEFGERLGLAFQIADDVLDVTSDSSVLGKTVGKDSDADKATFVSLLGVDAARRAAAAEAEAALAAVARTGLGTPLLKGLARFAVHRDR
jgi:geranylgeranyl pyrophosphate synthase